jgi:hypothetical protein
MDNAERAKRIKRVLALMEKTTANGCSKEEAMAAAEKVRELMDQYDLSLSDLEIKETETKSDFINSGGKSEPAISFLLNAIATFTDTKVWLSYDKHDYVLYNFFGLDHDVEIAKYIYKVCDWAIIWEWEDYKKGEHYKNTAPHMKGRLKDSFQIGMVEELSRRLIYMKNNMNKKNVESSGRDLIMLKGAVVEEAFAKLGLDLRAGRYRHRSIDGKSYGAGVEAGKRVPLNPGIKTGGVSGHIS